MSLQENVHFHANLCSRKIMIYVLPMFNSWLRKSAKYNIKCVELHKSIFSTLSIIVFCQRLYLKLVKASFFSFTSHFLLVSPGIMKKLLFFTIGQDMCPPSLSQIWWGPLSFSPLCGDILSFATLNFFIYATKHCASTYSKATIKWACPGMLKSCKTFGMPIETAN